jgi:hypothetical protein
MTNWGLWVDQGCAFEGPGTPMFLAHDDCIGGIEVTWSMGGEPILERAQATEPWWNWEKRWKKNHNARPKRLLRWKTYVVLPPPPSWNEIKVYGRRGSRSDRDG